MTDRDRMRKKAVALAYQKGDYAPKVIAKGHGIVAEAIIALAKESGVYVHQSPDLVNLLLDVNLDGFIPPELYVAIAELLAWLYWVEQGCPTTENPPKSPS
jgi:flagellar biosynthesis protein